VSLPVRTTDEADDQIRAIDAWWREHRMAAPDLFFDELAASFELIAQTPNIGRRYPHSPIPGTRRILLRQTRYHVYDVPGADDVRVPAVWHAQRGVGPPLRMP
jgi:plasmid stabilization system protein ParE